MSEFPFDEVSYYQEVEDPRFRHLKRLQCQRLAGTYADFIERPENRAACHFFFNRLYSTDDTHDRDEAFKKIYDTARRYLGGEVIESMRKLIELQTLTLELDRRLLDELEAMDAPEEFDLETYEEAYRRSDNHAGRVRQVELLEFTMRLVHSISHKFGIWLVLKGLRAASLVAGDTRMVDFLQEGYQAFVEMPDIEPLATTMADREYHHLDRIFGRLPTPDTPVEGYRERYPREA